MAPGSTLLVDEREVETTVHRVYAVKDIDVREQDRPGSVLSSGRQGDARGKRKRHDGYYFLN